MGEHYKIHMFVGGACESYNILAAAYNALAAERGELYRKLENFLRRTKLNVL
jgi:hypothetical protein